MPRRKVFPPRAEGSLFVIARARSRVRGSLPPLTTNPQSAQQDVADLAHLLDQPTQPVVGLDPSPDADEHAPLEGVAGELGTRRRHTREVDRVELADDVAGALQLADQFTYDNNFIYFQPGNGKVKIKEPKQQVQLASSKLGQLLGEK